MQTIYVIGNASTLTAAYSSRYAVGGAELKVQVLEEACALFLRTRGFFSCPGRNSAISAESGLYV